MNMLPVMNCFRCPCRTFKWTRWPGKHRQCHCLDTKCWNYEVSGDMKWRCGWFFLLRHTKQNWPIKPLPTAQERLHYFFYSETLISFAADEPFFVGIPPPISRWPKMGLWVPKLKNGDQWQPCISSLRTIMKNSSFGSPFCSKSSPLFQILSTLFRNQIQPERSGTDQFSWNYYSLHINM